MEYPVLRLAGEPCFDTLGVLRLDCGVETPVNDRIYAQAQAGRTDRLFFARILSFETDPAPAATLRCVLSRLSRRVELGLRFDQKAWLTLDGALVPDRLTAYQVGGGDLQGEYWGGVLIVPIDWLAEALGFLPDEPVILDADFCRENPACSRAACRAPLRLLLNGAKG